MPRVSLLLALAAPAVATDDDGSGRQTCGDMKQIYKDLECCGNPEQETGFMTVPNPSHTLFSSSTNYCAGQKSITEPALDNRACFVDSVVDVSEQAGADITAGFEGTMDSSITPIMDRYFKTALCPVNVHWHLGAEHRSEGEFDEHGTAPEGLAGTPASEAPAHDPNRRRLPDDYAEVRYGYACHHYTADDPKFNTEYAWQHCLDMHVGETYEIHWPHSSLGACGTPYQYQSPFYDGVFCHATADLLGSLTAQDIAANVGVQGQVFTIVNDEHYFYPDLIRGMLVDPEHDMGVDIGIYTGSTTGTSRDNEVCSAYTPITWQVDRKCHLISASSFDKMCADMKQMRDDMSSDLHAHGARELVLQELTANNQGDINP